MRSRYVVIDRFEGETAVCEDERGDQVLLSPAQLPAHVREGSVLRYRDGAFLLDEALEAQLRRGNQLKQRKVFRDE